MMSGNLNALKDHPIVKFYIEKNHFGKLLDMDFDIIGPGEIIYRMKVNNDHLATPLAAHGGAICALMDATMGVCALSNVIFDGKVVSTIEMKISFINPAKLDDELAATASTVKSGNKLLFIEGRIENQDKELIAVATGTFNAYPSAKAGF
jgi:uncharacterized protein (TIGR00369 family)